MTLDAFLRQAPSDTTWVFGYASLMWSPGFQSPEHTTATIHGYHRALCIYSHTHRGTPVTPGLVMGLCRGGACRGMAFRLPAAGRRAVLEMLWRREMGNRVYQVRVLKLRLADGRNARGLAFVADPQHRQFAGDLPLARTARLVAQGIGDRGRNIEYLDQTLAHLRALGVPDLHLEAVLLRVRALHRRAKPGDNRAQ